MRLLVLAALALLGGGHGTQTITGTISVNTGSSLTVVAPNHSLTCAVAYGKGQAAILKWGTGVRVAMACTYEKDHLVVSRLTRLSSTEPTHPTTTTSTSTETHPTNTTTTETHPTTTTSTETHPTTQQQRREAIGVIIALTSGGVGIKPDNGGEPFTCRITPALDSQQAAAKLTLGAHAGIVCRLDGSSWVLAGATLVS